MLEIITQESKEIDIKKISEEILIWLDKNVESFIDNQTKTFKIDMLIDSQEMSESMKMQSLYRKVTGAKLSDDEYKECMAKLNAVTEKIHKNMRKRDDLLEKLFKKMVFYYEMVGVNNGKQLIKELTGAVDIINFEYEAFSVGVKIKDKGYVGEEGIDGNNENNVKIRKQYEIPESFTIWVEISFKENRPSSIF